MIKQSLPAVSFVTADNFESFSKSDKVVIIGFFAADDTTSNNTFAAVSNAQRDDFIFGATNDAALAKKEGVPMPGVVMYKDFDEGKTVNTGEFEQAPLQAWIKQAAVPLMGEVGPETYTGYMESGLPLAYLFVDNDEDKKRLGDALLPVASKYRGKVNFATIDAVQFGGHASNLNLYHPPFSRLTSIVRRTGLRLQSKMLPRTRNSHTIKHKKSLLMTSRNLLPAT